MRWAKWLKELFFPEIDLRAANRAAKANVPRDVALAWIEGDPIFRHPAAARQREEVLTLIAGRFDEAARDRCLELLQEAVAAQHYLVRPGTVEELWALEGLFDRLLKP